MRYLFAVALLFPMWVSAQPASSNTNNQTLAAVQQGTDACPYPAPPATKAFKATAAKPATKTAIKLASVAVPPLPEWVFWTAAASVPLSLIAFFFALGAVLGRRPVVIYNHPPGP